MHCMTPICILNALLHPQLACCFVPADCPQLHAQQTLGKSDGQCVNTVHTRAHYYSKSFSENTKTTTETAEYNVILGRVLELR
jgi:hypothetical protein